MSVDVGEAKQGGVRRLVKIEVEKSGRDGRECGPDRKAERALEAFSRLADHVYFTNLIEIVAPMRYLSRFQLCFLFVFHSHGQIRHQSCNSCSSHYSFFKGIKSMSIAIISSDLHTSGDRPQSHHALTVTQAKGGCNCAV